MQSLSPFQTLPHHVAQMVVDYVASSSRQLFSGISIGSQRYMELQIPLLWVCRNFRTIVYSRFSRRYEMHFKRSMDGEDVTLTSWPLRFKGYYSPTQHLAKELVLEFDVWGVYIGKALEMLNSALRDEYTFPATRLLEIRFSRAPIQRQRKDMAADPLWVQANINAFVQRIKQVVPMVNEIKVGSRFYGSDLPPATIQCFGGLVTQLYQLANRISFSSYNGLPLIELQLDMIGELVHIDYKVSLDNHRQILELARRNALTLQSLTIVSEAGVDMSGLIRDAEGTFTEYLRLQTLKLTWIADVTVSHRLIFKGALPFPKLRRLQVTQDTPFGDDILFRGNSATLEFLLINVDRTVVDILGRHRVFTPTSHPKLQCVKVGHFSSTADPVVDVANYMQFVLSIAPGAPVREIRDGLAGPDLHTALSLLREHVALQVLAFPKLCLSLWDVIALIKALPLLSDLHTLPPYLGEIPDGKSQDELFSYVYSTFAPMGKRFRCWRVGYSWGPNPEEAVKCVRLLTLACPNFSHVVPSISDSMRTTLPSVATNASSSNDFDDYTTRVQHLLTD
ncbi:hypothetical protein IW146_002174 [Coemansia sp. RSA 922]|nr:hypothetical protein IW146_002174 [Coemansia sp. RSA 922]